MKAQDGTAWIQKPFYIQWLWFQMESLRIYGAMLTLLPCELQWVRQPLYDRELGWSRITKRLACGPICEELSRSSFWSWKDPPNHVQHHSRGLQSWVVDKGEANWELTFISLDLLSVEALSSCYHDWSNHDVLYPQTVSLIKSFLL